MLKLEVEGYCHDCLDFEPDVQRPTPIYADFSKYMTVGDTVIRCEYRERCKRLKKHLEEHSNAKN